MPHAACRWPLYVGHVGCGRNVLFTRADESLVSPGLRRDATGDERIVA